MTDKSCKACATRARANMEGQCPACAYERVRAELIAERVSADANSATKAVSESAEHQADDESTAGIK